MLPRRLKSYHGISTEICWMRKLLKSAEVNEHNCVPCEKLIKCIKIKVTPSIIMTHFTLFPSK